MPSEALHVPVALSSGVAVAHLGESSLRNERLLKTCGSETITKVWEGRLAIYFDFRPPTTYRLCQWWTQEQASQSHNRLEGLTAKEDLGIVWDMVDTDTYDCFAEVCCR